MIENNTTTYVEAHLRFKLDLWYLNYDFHSIELTTPSPNTLIILIMLNANESIFYFGIRKQRACWSLEADVYNRCFSLSY